MKNKLFIITALFILTNCSDSNEINHTLPLNTKKTLPKDSIYIKCLGDMGFVEKIDTIILDDGILTCKLGKYENCAYSMLDTFYLKNDTLNIKLTSPDKERLACDCYFEIYTRFNYNHKKPKSITINGNKIGSGHGIVEAKEK